MSQRLLSVHGLSKAFGGLLAVQDVDLAVARQEIVAIIGPNGAGKTTLFNVVSGLLRPSAGDVCFDGASIVGRPPERVVRLGLVRTFQNIRLFRRLTVLENVLVATFSTARGSLWSWALPGQRWRVAHFERAADETLALAGLLDKAHELSVHLSHGEQRRLEIARALATRPRLLLLDEPCAGLTSAETEELVRLIRTIREAGVTVMVIEHDMDFVMGLADRVVVLNFGRKIAEGEPRVIRENPDVVTAYLGAKELDARA